MSKKDYIDAVNEIQVDEKLKKETFEKVREKTVRRKFNKLYPLASLAVMCAVIMAIVLPNKSIAPISEKEYIQVKDAQELPRVESFKNLYAMLNKRAEKNGLEYDVDSIITINESNQEIIKAQNSERTYDTSKSQEDFSKTNTQVNGVDEADIVKTDGKYIYYLTNSKLVIVDVQNPSKMVSVSDISFEGANFYPHEIYLKEDKVIIIGVKEEETVYEIQQKILIDDDYIYPYRGKVFTSARVYDVKDKANPALERTVEIDGSYISSRMIDGDLYMISNKYLSSYICKKKKISELDEEKFKPQYLDTVAGEDVKSIDFDCIYYIPEFEESSYLNIAAFNVNNKKEAHVESYLGAGSEIYASTNNLYIAKIKYDYNRIRKESKVTTEIYKFILKNATCTFTKTGTVPGSVLNQFSMDEDNGFFRIATTDNSVSSQESTNNLYVLDENLDIVSKVEGLAPGERIYSVRFMGKRAYMVTFVETDPLFVIDLSDPRNPTVLGELKIPGYSKYLHPYDETHLIGIGEDTKIINEGYGERVVTDGMKIALFDVTDPNNPKEMFSEKIGEKGTSSELLYNHKALLFSKEKNIIAFPISITKENYEVTFQGAIVYGLSLDKGFELKAEISNVANDYDRYFSKNNVERIIYIKDTLYTLSKTLIKATDMNTMKTQGSLEIK